MKRLLIQVNLLRYWIWKVEYNGGILQTNAYGRFSLEQPCQVKQLSLLPEQKRERL